MKIIMTRHGTPWLGGCAALLALGSQGIAQAQVETGNELAEITVTASRINAAGFTAPTPTSVLTAADVERTAPMQITDALSQIPSFRFTGQSSSASQFANLRSIGATRTLVLVNGRRHVPTQPDGTFDLNLIPASLVSRTEVVTGGASASWGSDAVSGVVNLLLDTQLTGIKGNVQVGQSRYGDARTTGLSLAGGTSFAGGRGHVIAGAEFAQDNGIKDLQTPYFSRPWAYEERASISNPNFATNGSPGVIYTTNVRRADTSAGGLITTGPMRGLQFDPSGALVPFSYGTLLGNTMIGGGSNQGETGTPGGDLRYPYRRYSFLTHAEYEFGANTTGFVEASYAHSLTNGAHTNAIRFDAAVTGTTSCTSTTAATSLGTIAVNINNAYLPAAAKAQMQALGITCFGMGRTFRDLENLRPDDGSPWMWRAVAGLKGKIGEWSWNAYVQEGKNRSQQIRAGNLNMTNFRQAIDAVRDSSGNIVCRVALTGTTGCVPLNLFGSGSVSAAAAAYVTGTSQMISDTTQTVAAADVQGDVFSLPAGPVRLATGVEYRKEELNTTVDALSAADLWQTGNRKAAKGSYDVKEVFVETNLPLLKDQPVFKALDLNAAARHTNYSSSGGVTTWKVGLTWDLNSQVLVRATRSSDIRAGNLSELYTPFATTTANLRNSVTGVTLPGAVETRGNPSLNPEKAQTLTYGISYHPNWADGLRLSADAYRIEIKDAIGTLTAQQIIDRCYLDKVQEYCSNFIVTDTTGAITRVITPFLNLNKFKTSGLDLEAQYRFSMQSLGVPGMFTARVLANNVRELATTATINSTVTDPSGQYNSPSWTVFGTLTWERDRFSGTLDMRYYQGGKIDKTLTQGLLAANGVNINHVGSTVYTNVSAQYNFGADRKLQVYARINNLFDRWPPFPSNGGGLFDEVGQAFRIGLRFSH